MSNLLFPAAPLQLDEAYHLLKEVISDIRNIPQALTTMQFKKVAKELRRTLNTIKLVCVKIDAEAEIARDFDKPLKITYEERREIVEKINRLSDELNVFVEQQQVQEFLRNYADLGRVLFLKMYGEGEDYTSEDIYQSEQEFLSWIASVIFYIDKVIQELDRTVATM